MRRARLALSAALLFVPACQENVLTEFPEGFEPWEEHAAPLPDPVGDDACPETLVFVRNPRYEESWNVHATACIHQPIETVFASVREATTSRDPTTTTTFEALPPMAEECDGDYQTAVHVDDVVDVDFRTCWRHTVVSEDETGAPTVTATRWQKVWGSSFISVMEGSIVLAPLESDPNITVVRYQYHLNALSSSNTTVENFLGVIYGRLRDHANGVALTPP